MANSNSLRSPKHRYRAEISLVSKTPKGGIGRRQTTALTASSINEFRPLIEQCFPIRVGLEAIEVTIFENKKSYPAFDWVEVDRWVEKVG